MRKTPSRTAIAATISAAALTAGAIYVATGNVPGGDSALSATLGRRPHHLGEGSWRVSYQLGSGLSDLQDVEAVASHSVWAVGSVQDGGGDLRHAVALHWDGQQWTDTPLPAPFQKADSPLGSSGLTLVRSASGSVWAFGWAKGGRARYALSWNGVSWSVSHEWDAYGDFTDAAVTGATNVWVFDDRPGSTTQVGTWHFDGVSWTRSNTSFHLIAAKALSRGDIWATALTPSGKAFRPTVAHWDGWRWRTVPTPSLHSDPGLQAVLTAITATSASNVWAVGYEAHKGAFVPVALHWDGARWRRADPHGTGYGLYSVTQDGRGGIWAAEGEGYQGGVIHFSSGKWSSPALPRLAADRVLAIRTVSLDPDTNAIWAAGILVWGTPPQTGGVILDYS